MITPPPFDDGAAAASQAAMILLGEASWMPKVPMQAIGLDNGRLMIGDA